ncbi:histone-like DNA-binding protein HU [Acetobacter nitrogenifigens DSM 23921 = NBRC 105050]|uniref:Transcriptional regulator n=2 Tax=Acetobacter nitrogenifigens TaxID=285268 RepID=A0A511XEW4_9PROT|nr:histone-like DNA-binding protein HU [Acetobacter nitrogenifigens DSM 23921 = NBRC 105050]GEN61487.1 transcriptional regulator [Acetobacter nitrogenifigens DSM 23921 = NBRC 105050]
MTNNDLIERISAAADITKKDAKTALETVFAAIREAAAKGEETSISGFGKFVVRSRPERTGRNPQTGEEMTIPAGRKLAYTPAKAVKDSLAGA